MRAPRDASKGIVALPKEEADIYAIRAVAQGVANDIQQKRAIECIINEIAGTYDMTFDETNGKLQDFREGTRHVGRVIVNTINVSMDVIKRPDQK
jgi:hypothetical protein